MLNKLTQVWTSGLYVTDGWDFLSDSELASQYDIC